MYLISMRVAYSAMHFIYGTAIRALGRAAFGNVKIHLWMRVPLLHACQGRWAKDAPLGVQVGGFEFNGCASSHGAILKEVFTKPL